MKNYTIAFKKVKSAFALSLFLMTCVAIIPIVDATRNDINNGQFKIPYMSQKYANIGESACGPTSIAMVLKYYYPSITITGEDVYHSGTQGYTYNGPVVGYKNVGFATDTKGKPLEKGLSIVAQEFQQYYGKNHDSNCMYPNVYLENYWGGPYKATKFTAANLEDQIQKHIPVFLHGKGHYVVLRGYDDKNTLKGTNQYDDDIFYVNDPYPWKGVSTLENRPYSFKGLQGSFSVAEVYIPSLSSEQRMYTTLVDGSNVVLDDINAKDAKGKYIWQEYYGNGIDYYYPTVGGHSATWNPKLVQEGKYKIHIIFKDIKKGGNIEYSAYSLDGSKIATKSIIQNGDKKWRDEILGTVNLKAGSYVKAKNVPANCIVDAVRFEYVGLPTPKITKYYFQQNSYKSNAWKNQKYTFIELFGKKYVPLKSATPNKLAPLVVDNGNTITLVTGETLDLQQGYILRVNQVDIKGNKVWILFTKDGQYIDDRIISTATTWTCNMDKIQGEDIVPVLKVHVNKIYKYDKNTDVVDIDGIWLIDFKNAFTIKSGDKFNGHTITEINNQYISLS